MIESKRANAPTDMPVLLSSETLNKRPWVNGGELIEVGANINTTDAAYFDTILIQELICQFPKISSIQHSIDKTNDDSVRGQD